MTERYPPIRDYAVVGDCHGAALVSRAGSVDWCCLGRFDSDPVLCRMLDADRGGYLSITPPAGYEARRGYLDGSNVLRTTFAGDGGTVSVTDFMTVGRRPGSGTHNYVDLVAPGWLVRLIEGERGSVPLQVRYRPSPAFARHPTRLRVRRGRLEADAGPVLHHDLPGLAPEGPNLDTAAGVAEIAAGERRALVLARTAEPAPGLPADAERLRDITQAFWTEWLAYCRYEGDHAAAVRRSALALKLLIYAPTGAIAASCTTSLPECIGSARNWDYRYCWLRDASFTLYALAALGYGGEAREFSAFLTHACATGAAGLQIMYGIGGEATLAEQTLDHLEGYRGSTPVRTGNCAYRQWQTDVYGEILDWALLYDALGGRLDDDTKAMLADLADVITERWSEPDHGLWEMRAPPRHHLHSKIMSWVAMDRALSLLGDKPTWRAARQRILDEVLEHGIDATGGHLLQAYGHSGADAALLLVPALGFPVDEATVDATLAAVERELRHGDYVFRYSGEDGLSGQEGAFMLCSFWLVDTLLHRGRHDEAKKLFARLCDRGNDVGLFSEEIDPATNAFLGNMPQAFTHLGLISTAANLQLYEDGGPQALAGSFADRARRGIGATLGWRGLWAAFRATRRVGRLLPSRRSVLDPRQWGDCTATVG